MSAASAWAAAHLRRRWLALLLLGLVPAVAGAATLTAVAGARRTATTYERHVDAVSGAHGLVATDFDPDLWRIDALDPFLAAEGVVDSTVVVPFAMRPAGTDAYLIFDVAVMGAADTRVGTTIERFRIEEGRVFDHARPDEAVVSADYAERFDVRVGDTITFESWTQPTLNAAIRANFTRPPPDGPTVEVIVVGISREVGQIVPTEQPGTVYLTHAFTRQRSNQIGISLPFGFVRLAGGSASYPAFADALRDISQETGLPYITDQPTADNAQVAGSIDAQVLALLVFAVVAAGAGMVVTLAALARQLAHTREDQAALRALGMTRAERVGGVVVLGAVPAVVAAVGAAALAIAGSALVPIGTPGAIEPEPGVRLDAVVLVVGGLAVGAIVLALAAAAATGATRVTPPRPTPARPGLGAAVGRWLSASVPLSTGVRLALDRGRGSRSLPTRVTVLGLVVGLGGAAGALVFAAGLDHLVATPRLYGVAPDIMVGAEGGPDEWQTLARRVEGDDAFAEVATVISVQLVVDGDALSGIVMDPRRGDPVNVVVAGRTLQARDEVVVGRALADHLGVDVGDSVEIARADGSPMRHTVVGIAAHPNLGEDYRRQLAVLGDSLEPFLTFDTGPWYGVLATFANGADGEAAVAALADEGFVTFPTAFGAGAPRAVANVEEVAIFPIVLAGLLGALAAVSLLHALATTTRRRGTELAVLRALGCSSRQLRLAGAAQATTLVVVGLVVGVPLGLGAGRNAWGSVASGLGVATAQRLPAWPPAWVVAIGVAAATVGALAVRTAVRGHPATALRRAHRE